MCDSLFRRHTEIAVYFDNGQNLNNPPPQCEPHARKKKVISKSGISSLQREGKIVVQGWRFFWFF